MSSLRQRALLLFLQTQTSKHQGCIHKRTIFMVDDSYVSMVSEILPCHNDLWCLWWVDFLVLFISKYCYQIYGVLKYIANISGLTALARYHSGALFLEGFDRYSGQSFIIYRYSNLCCFNACYCTFSIDKKEGLPKSAVLVHWWLKGKVSTCYC